MELSFWKPSLGPPILMKTVSCLEAWGYCQNAWEENVSKLNSSRYMRDYDTASDLHRLEHLDFHVSLSTHSPYILTLCPSCTTALARLKQCDEVRFGGVLPLDPGGWSKHSIFRQAVEVADSKHRAVMFSCGLIQLDTEPVTCRDTESSSHVCWSHGCVRKTRSPSEDKGNKRVLIRSLI